MPLVTVIVPTHNRPGLLAEALASVRAQTFTDHAAIAVSNGHDSPTRRESQAVAADHNCRYFAISKGNQSAARNFAAAHGRCRWIAFLDDDDIWMPQKLERQLAEAECTGADMISCDYIEFHVDGREVI